MKFRAVGLLWFLLGAVAFAAPPALVPLPQLLQTNAGSFTLCPPQVIPGAPAPSPTVILVDGAGRETGEYLATLLFKSTGYRFQVGTNSGAAPVPQAILLTTNSALSSLGTEGYELTVATNSVVIRAPASAGLFYGVQTLLQLLPPEIYAARPVTGVPWTAPCVYIQDWPRFSWRGWMLDSVRHFFTKDEVKSLIDTLAYHKLNVFHWHLDDDSGWRLEIKKWPLLTQVSAWRTGMMWNLNPRASQSWDGTNYGGFYTQADAREVVEYAAQRHIMVVPEIEMPGHSSSALAAYPQFACGCTTCSNGPYSLNVTSYVGGVFCVARPETTSFLHDVLTEVMDVFPGPYIHIGGDEVNTGNWQKHALDQALTNSLGITNWQAYQKNFSQQMANWIKSQGRTMIGWSEIVATNTAMITNTAVMDWLNGTSSRAIQTATNRQNVVMCPQRDPVYQQVGDRQFGWQRQRRGLVQRTAGTIGLRAAHKRLCFRADSRRPPRRLHQLHPRRGGPMLVRVHSVTARHGVQDVPAPLGHRRSGLDTGVAQELDRLHESPRCPQAAAHTDGREL